MLGLVGKCAVVGFTDDTLMAININVHPCPQTITNVRIYERTPERHVVHPCAVLNPARLLSNHIRNPHPPGTTELYVVACMVLAVTDTVWSTTLR